MASESLRQFLRAEVLLAVGPAAAPGLCWSDCQLPTLRDVSCLRPNFSTARLGVEVLFEDNSAATAFEASDGNWEGVAAQLAAPRRSSVETLSSLFAYHVLPSAAHVATRSKHWRCWRGILTWAVARRCTSQVLPMERAALQGLLMDLLSLGCGASTIKGYLDCIQGRHRAHDLPSPMRGSSSYQVICSSLKRFQGRQAPYKFPIHRSLVVKLLDFEAPTLARRRDCLAAALATICCLRPSEGARLQSCDVFFDFDVASGFPGYRGTAAINVMSRKNDQDRKGHHPRIGRSRSDSLDLVHQLRRFMEEAGTEPRPGCSKRMRPQARCLLCPPLFPLSKRGKDWHAVMSDEHPSPNAFSGMVLRALRNVGCDTRAFSGVCARRGGLSTAIEAGVPEPVLWLQSGHAQCRSASRLYIRLSNPDLLFATWRSFNL